MNNQQNVFFFEIQQIPDNSLLFDELKKQELFFSYFQVDRKYYLFFFQQKSIDIDSIDPFIDIIQELDTKQRKIRSLRGFFLYALEIMETKNDSKILDTNLKPSFWRKVKTSLRQNKKEVLLECLFGPQHQSDLEEKVQILENKVFSLEEKIIALKAKLNNQTIDSEDTLRGQNKAAEAPKSIQQGIAL